jgi:hypothetical protein
MKPVELITKSNKPSKAYKKLKSAMRFDTVGVEIDSKGISDYHNISRLIFSEYLTPIDCGLYGGIRYQITEKGREAMQLARTQLATYF